MRSSISGNQNIIAKSSSHHSKMMTSFSQKVIQLIKKIPRGKVATYGQIALLAGNPRGARGVSWILHSSSTSHKLPWQRVINSKGKISFPLGTKKHQDQKNKLRRRWEMVSSNLIIHSHLMKMLNVVS